MKTVARTWVLIALACSSCGGRVGGTSDMSSADGGNAGSSSGSGSGSSSGAGSGSGSSSGAMLPDASSCPGGETLCGAACVDEQTDTSNCGGCGIACSGTCTSGRCLVQLSTQAADGIAVEGGSVYWVWLAGTTSGIATMPTGGGVTVTLATFGQGDGVDVRSGLHVGGTHVYWFDNYTVKTVPIGGGAVTTLAVDPGTVNGMTTDVDSIYWSAFDLNVQPPSGHGRVMKMPLSGGAPVTLTSSLGSPEGITVDANNVYGLDIQGPGSLFSVPKAGGPVVTLATEQTTAGQVGEPSAAPVLGSGRVSWWDQSGLGNGALMSIPIVGGTARPLVSAPSQVLALASDSTSIYWSGFDDGNVYELSLSGGAVVTLVSGQAPTSIAVDDTSVYWTNMADTGLPSAPNGVWKLTPK